MRLPAGLLALAGLLVAATPASAATSAPRAFVDVAQVTGWIDPVVADFVGLTNRIQGTVSRGTVDVRGATIPLVDSSVPDGPATALVRPEAVSLVGNGEAQEGPLVGTVIAVAFLGATSRVTVDLGDITVLAQLATSAAAEHPAGTRVRLALRPDPVLVDSHN